MYKRQDLQLWIVKQPGKRTSLQIVRFLDFKQVTECGVNIDLGDQGIADFSGRLVSCEFHDQRHTCTALKNGDEVISSLYERILGRVSVHDIINPTTGKLIVSAGEEITEEQTNSRCGITI